LQTFKILLIDFDFVINWVSETQGLACSKRQNSHYRNLLPQFPEKLEVTEKNGFAIRIHQPSLNYPGMDTLVLAF
jgi:hypothetical protein